MCAVYASFAYVNPEGLTAGKLGQPLGQEFFLGQVLILCFTVELFAIYIWPH